MRMEQFTGVGAAPGLALGQAVRWRKVRPRVEEKSVEDSEQEIARLERAVDRTKEQIGRLRRATEERMGKRKRPFSTRTWLSWMIPPMWAK